MSLNKEDVSVELRTVIQEGKEKEMNVIKQVGTYVYSKGREVITFTEETEMGDVRNFITIQEKKVTIQRSGNITMHQKFVEGKVTESVYRHPYGVLHLEIMTHDIKYNPYEKEHCGEVIIQYDMVINGEQKREHHLTLTYGGERK